MSNADKWCFAWFEGEQTPGAQSRAALAKANKWDVGNIITVGFLDGTKNLQQKVKDVAKNWIGPTMANLQFSFLADPTNADVRVSFQYAGSWSTIGTTC